jgi:hypothetical protein
MMNFRSRPTMAIRSRRRKRPLLEAIEDRVLLSALTYNQGPIVANPAGSAIEYGVTPIDVSNFAFQGEISSSLGGVVGPPASVRSVEGVALSPVATTTGLSLVSTPDTAGLTVPQENDPNFVGPPSYANPNMSDTPDKPVPITGTYLANGAEPDPGYDKAMSFDKVIQGQSNTCAFASTLSAVALSNFDLASDISYVSQKGPDDYLYKVRLFTPGDNGTFSPVWIPEEFNGTINAGDATSTDPSEFWPALFQRAYLELEATLGQNYQTGVNAFEALTGQQATASNAIGLGQAITPQWIEQNLNNGTPMIAGTVDASDPYNLDPSAGIIGNHDYTVVGIQIPPNDPAALNTYVTLRNPWGIDTYPKYFDTDGDYVLNGQEWHHFQQGLDGSNDGIIRVSWGAFQQYYDAVVASKITGPSINYPQDPPPSFKNPADFFFTVTVGQQVGPLDISAIDPDGLPVAYHLEAGNPGSVDANGQYTWIPQITDVGDYYITVFAQSNPLKFIGVYLPGGRPARPGDDRFGLRHARFGQRHRHSARHAHRPEYQDSRWFRAGTGLLGGERREHVRLSERRGAGKRNVQPSGRFLPMAGISRRPCCGNLHDFCRGEVHRQRRGLQQQRRDDNADDHAGPGLLGVRGPLDRPGSGVAGFARRGDSDHGDGRRLGERSDFLEFHLIPASHGGV